MIGVQVIQKVTFGKPVVGPRAYVSTSGCGWPERFPKVEADRALKEFVGEVDLAELIDNFQEFLDLKRNGTSNWSDVNSYLGRIFEATPEEISYQVAIAFWAHVIVRKKTKPKEVSCPSEST